MNDQTKPQTSDWRVYKRLLGYLVPLWKPFLISIIGYVLFTVAQVLAADWMQFVIDTLAGVQDVDGGVVSGMALELLPDARTDFEFRRNLIVGAVVSKQQT